MKKLLAVAALAAALAVPSAAFAESKSKFAQLEESVPADVVDAGKTYALLLGALGSQEADVTALQRECPGIGKTTGEIGPKTLECVKRHADAMARTRNDAAKAHAEDAANAAKKAAEDEKKADAKPAEVDPRLAVATEAFVVANCAKKAKVRWLEPDAHFLCRTENNEAFEGECKFGKGRNKRRVSCAEVVVAAALKPAPPSDPTPKDSTFWCNQGVGQGLICYVPVALALGFGTVGAVKAARNDLAVFEQR